MLIDVSLQKSARALEAAAAEGRALRPLLKKLCPHIHRQIISDGKTPGLMSFWGRSVNVDENTKQTIVHPAILQAIGTLAGVPMSGRFVHAGLQHTYGYLFSLVETPYGPKRERWTSEEWERCFGLDTTLLGPLPSTGTLLANLTWFLGQIALRSDARWIRRRGRIEPAVADELAHYDFSQLDVCRIVETVSLTKGTRRDVRIITDLIQLPHPPTKPETMSALLIYSIQNGAKAPLRLITAFPIREPVERELHASAGPGKVPVRLRYNAYYPGLTGRTVSGRRIIVPSAVTAGLPASRGTQRQRSRPGSGSRG